jgi:hypothetical protein
VGGEGGAVEDDALAGALGRDEPAVVDPDRLGERAEVGEGAATDVLEDVAVGQAAESPLSTAPKSRSARGPR